MRTSLGLTRKDITYWIIFLMYVFVVTFSLVIFTQVVENEIILASVNLSV